MGELSCAEYSEDGGRGPKAIKLKRHFNYLVTSLESPMHPLCQNRQTVLEVFFSFDTSQLKPPRGVQSGTRIRYNFVSSAQLGLLL